MHTNHRIILLVRASRLFCYGLYQDYEPKNYNIIKAIVLHFTNRLFGTKGIEDQIQIEVTPQYKLLYQIPQYVGVNVILKFPDTSLLEFSLFNRCFNGTRYRYKSDHDILITN